MTDDILPRVACKASSGKCRAEAAENVGTYVPTILWDARCFVPLI